ncbi:MAG: cytochrome P450 [Chloroflexota bacterium]
MINTEQLSINQQRRQPTLSSTSHLPLIGSIPQMMRQQTAFLTEAHRKHGDIFNMSLGPLSFVALNHPEQAQHLFIDNARNYTKDSAFWESIRTLLGNGLPLSQGDFWLRQRRMIQPQFHRQRLVDMGNLMNEAIHKSMASWESIANGETPFDIAHEMTQVTMSVIVRTMFGTDLADEDSDTVADEMNYALNYMVFGMIAHSIPDWVPVPGRKRYLGSIAAIDDVVFRVIEQRHQEKTEGADLVSILYNMVDAETGERMTGQQLRDEAVSMFIAGYETTAVSLAWAFHFLSQRPEIERKLVDEVDSVLNGRVPTFADLPKLTYTKMVLQEAMRLYPPAFWLPRTAIEDDEIDGYHIPAGSTVGAVIYNIHRNPAIWEEPDEFIPERFTPDKMEQRHKLAWMPFGAGQRMCIAKEFALMEGQLILAQAMQRYRITPIPGRTVQPALTTSLRVKDGVWVTLERR